MKPLFSALLETIVLVVSIFLVMLCAKLLKFESDFDNYSELYPDKAITVGNAMGYFTEGTTPTPDEASVILGQRFFGEDSGKKFPAPIAKLFCTEISENIAKVLELYYFIVFIESILCLIFGITLPCSLYRHIDPAKSINNFFINENLVYEDKYGMTYGHVGETRAGIVKVLLLLLMLFVSNIWCSFMPLFIIVNFIVGIIMLICRIVGVKAADSTSKTKIKHAEGTSGSEVYRIIVDNGLFMVTGDKHPNRGIYFRKYWNAVAARRIMELDERVMTFRNEDVDDAIKYGDENLRKSYDMNCAINNIVLFFKPSAGKKAAQIKKEVKNKSYTFARVRRGTTLYEYMIISKCSGKYLLIRVPSNCSLMHAVLDCDAKGEVFEMLAWNRWDRLCDSDKLKVLDCHTNYIDPPKEEMRRTAVTKTN